MSIEHGLTQCVLEPTRRQGDTENTLELSLPTILNASRVSPSQINIIIDLNLAPKTKRRVNRKIFIRKKADTDNIKKAMDDLQKDYFDHCSKSDLGANQKWEYIRDELTTIMNSFVPSKMSSCRYNLPWFNSSLRKQCIRTCTTKPKDLVVMLTGRILLLRGKV